VNDPMRWRKQNKTAIALAFLATILIILVVWLTVENEHFLLVVMVTLIGLGTLLEIVGAIRKRRTTKHLKD
jgi:Flp pilus assembly protein TadB